MIVSACKLDCGREIFIKKGPPIEIVYRDEKDYTLISLGNEDEEVLDFNSLLRQDDFNIYLGTSKGRIFKSVDGGHSWVVVENGIFTNAGYVLLHMLGNTVFAHSQNSTSIYSLDNGNTWNYMEPIPWNDVELM